MKNLMKVLPLLLIVLTSCSKQEAVKQEKTENESFKFCTWMTADVKKPDSVYLAEFQEYSDAGVSEVLINTNTDPKLLERLVPLAKKAGLKVHAWIMAMNRPNDSIALQHPDWYTVNRNGESCFDHRPYVDYYQWMCPNREAARNHVLQLVENLAKVDGIETVHLDYIRFCDIFLPVGLLPKYNLTQNTELPEFDYCYCDVCVEKFQKVHHRNPREMAHPEIDMEWKQFRLNSIKNVVDEAYEIVHKHGKDLSAAVFPYPEMADHMVRQRWDKWQIDKVFPMIYNNFYNEGTDWVGFATKQGVNDLQNTKTKLYTGIYVPPLTPEELKKAIEEAKENGAKGVAFFDAPALTPEQLAVIAEMSDKK